MLSQQIVSGLGTGAIYALLGLALVIIYQATHYLNLAQGEMAMFSTFVAWQLIHWGLPFWVAFAATVALSFAAGVILQATLMRAFRGASVFVQVGVTVSLFLILNSLAGYLWGPAIKSFPSPFHLPLPLAVRGLTGQTVGMIAVALVLVVALRVFLRGTRTGLMLRAAAENGQSASLLGIPVERMRMIGWGLAAAIGAIAGMLVAPVVFLEPNMMFPVLPYAFAAAVVGGLTSGGGTVVAGFGFGVVDALSTAYLPTVGRELKLVIAVALIVVVLVLRPQGLFAPRRTVRT